MEEIKDFTYEFDFSILSAKYSDGMPLSLFLGYTYLHQFTVQDLAEEADDSVLEEEK